MDDSSTSSAIVWVAKKAKQLNSNAVTVKNVDNDGDFMGERAQYICIFYMFWQEESTLLITVIESFSKGKGTREFIILNSNQTWINSCVSTTTLPSFAPPNYLTLRQVHEMLLLSLLLVWSCHREKIRSTT